MGADLVNRKGGLTRRKTSKLSGPETLINQQLVQLTMKIHGTA